MSKSRVNILYRAKQAHIIFRCHNREFLFKEDFIKDQILNLWNKYKRKYEILIFDFVIMDNHAHLLIQFRSQKSVSDFMRVVNSQIARVVNEFYERDSQVVRERFRSPVIRSRKYFRNVIAYIWKNCSQIPGIRRLDEYKYCSLHRRIHCKECSLLDCYNAAGFPIGPSFRSFAESLVRKLRKTFFDPRIYENCHLVDDSIEIRANERYFNHLFKMYRLIVPDGESQTATT